MRTRKSTWPLDEDVHVREALVREECKEQGVQASEGVPLNVCIFGVCSERYQICVGAI